MKKFRSLYMTGALLSGAMLLIIASCQFGMQDFFGRLPQVDQRSGTLTELKTPLGTPPGGMGGVGGFSNRGGNEGKLRFLIVTDLHYGSKSGYPEDIIFSQFNTMRPDFILMLGDSAEAGLQSSFDQYEDFLSRLRSHTQEVGYMAPDFAILGNHDLYNNGLAAWKKVRSGAVGEGGETFYRFTTEVEDASNNKYKRSWYFLDSASSTLGNKQLDALSGALKNDPNPKFVFSHYPLFASNAGLIDYFQYSDVRERAKLLNMFDKANVNMLFSGHWHKGDTYWYGNFREVCGGSFRPDTVKEHHWYYVTVDEAGKTITVEENRLPQGAAAASLKKISTTYDFSGRELSRTVG